MFGGVFADVLGDFHRAEVRAAHGAEVGGFRAVLGERFVVELAGGFGIEAEVELVLPAEPETGLVAVLGVGVAFGEFRSGGEGLRLGSGDFAIFPAEERHVPSLLFGGEAFRHGFGGSSSPCLWI